jgi:hypothetical protein
MTSRIKLIPAVFVALIILPVSFAQAVEPEPNVLEKLRSLKATKIAQLVRDCNYTQQELDKSMRARIVPESNRSSKGSTREKYQKPKPLIYPSREDKTAAINALREKIEILQQNLAKAEANDLNIIIEDVFREPFAVGQIGRVHFDKEHPLQRMRINAIIDKNNCLVDFKIGTLIKREPTMGVELGGESVEGYNLRHGATRERTIDEDYGNPLSVIKTIWLKGFKTNGRVDGSEIDNPPILIITGTRTYDTIMGTKRTVYVFEPLEIPTNAL